MVLAMVALWMVMAFCILMLRAERAISYETLSTKPEECESLRDVIRTVAKAMLVPILLVSPLVIRFRIPGVYFGSYCPSVLESILMIIFGTVSCFPVVCLFLEKFYTDEITSFHMKCNWLRDGYKLGIVAVIWLALALELWVIIQPYRLLFVANCLFSIFPHAVTFQMAVSRGMMRPNFWDAVPSQRGNQSEV